MKKHLSKLLLLIPLLFIGGLAYATYNFVGPATAPGCTGSFGQGTPTGCNTDGPLVDTSTDQVKLGGLSVNTFSAAYNSLMNQDAIFTGPIFGGTPSDPTAPVVIGDTTNSAGVAITGSESITGVYQSNSLETGKGNGQKPLCATSTGEFYICGTTPVGSVQKVLIYPSFTTVQVGNAAVVNLSHWVSSPVSAELYYTAAGWQPSKPLGFLNNIKNSYTAYAIPQGVCPSTTQPIDMGTAYISPGSTTSQPIVLPSNCTDAQLSLSIGTYSPHSSTEGSLSGSVPIVLNN